MTERGYSPGHRPKPGLHGANLPALFSRKTEICLAIITPSYNYLLSIILFALPSLLAMDLGSTSLTLTDTPNPLSNSRVILASSSSSLLTSSLKVFFRDLYLNLEPVQIVDPIHHQLVLRLDTGYLQQNTLHHGGKYIDPADDQHIIRAAQYFLNAGMGAAARTGARAISW